MSKSDKLIIGTAGGHNAAFDIPQLLVSRLLVQASSGGGKSFLLRRMMEQGFGKVQQIVIDPAGEFATLREKFGFVLVGEHGETPADIRSAALVAEKLLELRASAVCDLYSLKPPERHIWVERFLTAVMNAPKKLWHPVLFYIDEAHKFCPEKGEGESVAKEMMLSLGSDGRKYGFCMIPATQRLAKLDKSLASELHNVLIGPTWIDIDLERAHKALGIIRRDQAAFDEQIKILEPGHFWALGRAISKTRILVKVGGILTTHPTAGSGKYSAEPPPPPEKVKALLPKLADLPQEAETKARTEAEFRREIRELKTKLHGVEKAASHIKPAQPVSTYSKPDPQQARTILQMRAALEETMRIVAKVTAFGFEQTKVNPKQLEDAVKKAVEEIGRSIANAGDIRRKEFEKLKRDAEALLKRLESVIDKKINISVDVVRAQPPFVLGAAHAHANKPSPPAAPPKPARQMRAPIARSENNGDVKLGAIHLQIAGILAGYYPDPVKGSILASLCGKSMGGSWSARLSEVRAAGLLEDPASGYVRATEKCAREYLGTFQAPSTTEEVLAVWDPKWSAVNKAMIRFLIERAGEAVKTAELAQGVGLTPGGSFSARLSELRSSGLLNEPAKGMVAANKEALFLEAA